MKDIDLDAIARNRDQLWAEAVAAFLDGAQWWLSPKAEEEAILAQAERAEDDPWQAKIVEYVRDRKEVSPTEILGNCFSVEAGRQGRAEGNRVAGIPRRIGFRKDGKFWSGDKRGQVRYTRGSGV